MAVPKSLKRRVQTAIVAFIKQCSEGRLDDYQYIEGFESAVRQSPRIEVLCKSEVSIVNQEIAEERDITLEVGVVTEYKEDTQDSHAIAEDVIADIMYDDGFIDRLNALQQTDFTAINWVPSGSEDDVVNERKERLTVFTGMITCLNSQV